MFARQRVKDAVIKIHVALELLAGECGGIPATTAQELTKLAVSWILAARDSHVPARLKENAYLIRPSKCIASATLLADQLSFVD